MKRLIALIVVVLIVLSGGVYAVMHKTPQKFVEQAENAPQSLSADAILALVNKARLGAGVPELVNSPELVKSAAEKCQDMVDNNYYAHENPTTGKHGYEYIQAELPAAKYTAAENLAQVDSSSAQDVLDRWLNSPEHKATMLNGDYTLTGIAVCKTHDIWAYNDIVEHFAYIPTPYPAQKTVYVPTYSPPASVNCFTQSEPAVGTFPATSITHCN